jgi:hypothetical protein
MDPNFLAPPGDLLDWRRVILTHLASDAGLLDRLPGTADALAAPDPEGGDAGLDPHSVRVVLEALTVWEVVTVDGDGRFTAGPELPGEAERHQLRQHAQFISRWANDLPARLPDHLRRDRAPRSPEALAGWLRSLGARARQQAPAMIDRCLEAFPDAHGVLDLAGGHGEYGMEAARRGLEVTLFDLPSVIDVVGTWPAVIESGVVLRPGDAFADDLGGPYDLVLCFGFSHTQPGERIAGLFHRLGRVTAPGGGIAVSTFARGESDVARLFAIQMLVAGNGGDTHRLDDYRRWLTDAGYGDPALGDRDTRTLLLAARAPATPPR